MIQNIKELRPKLNVEVLRNPPDVIVLEDREIQIRQPWPNHNVTAGITPKVEADRIWFRRIRARTVHADGRGVAVSIPIRRAGRCWNREAVGVDVNGKPRRTLLKVQVGRA